MEKVFTIHITLDKQFSVRAGFKLHSYNQYQAKKMQEKNYAEDIHVFFSYIDNSHVFEQKEDNKCDQQSNLRSMHFKYIKNYKFTLTLTQLKIDEYRRLKIYYENNFILATCLLSKKFDLLLLVSILLYRILLFIGAALISEFAYKCCT